MTRVFSIDAGKLVEVRRPGPDDDWSGLIPVDGQPAPTYPISIQFSQAPQEIREGYYGTEPYGGGWSTEHVGYWINTVPIWGIPEEGPLLLDFLHWCATEYVHPDAIGILVVDGNVCIPPPEGCENYIYAIIERVDDHTAQVIGFVEEADIGSKWTKDDNWAVVPAEEIRKW